MGSRRTVGGVASTFAGQGHPTEARDMLSPTGVAANLLSHPMRRWALIQALGGPITTRDLAREFSAVTAMTVLRHLNALVQHGLLTCDRSRPTNNEATVYHLGDLSALRDLHSWLGVLLAETPEVNP